MTDLDKLEELAKAATPGPWELVDHNEGMCPPRPLWGVINDEFVNPSGDDEAEWLAIEVHVGARPDAEFIALSRDAVPELIADHRAVLARIAKVEALHHKITRYGNDSYSISDGSYTDDPSSYEDLEPFDLCAECYEVEKLICEECGGDAPIGHRSSWPCPTARALAADSRNVRTASHGGEVLGSAHHGRKRAPDQHR